MLSYYGAWQPPPGSVDRLAFYRDALLPKVSTATNTTTNTTTTNTNANTDLHAVLPRRALLLPRKVKYDRMKLSLEARGKTVGEMTKLQLVDGSSATSLEKKGARRARARREPRRG